MDNSIGKFWLRDAHNHPVALIGYQYSQLADTNTEVVRYTYAIQRDGDPFDRAKAHKLVDGRLAKDRRCFVTLLSPIRPEIRRVIVDFILQMYAGFEMGREGWSPGMDRLRDLATKWIQRESERA
jgi:hypothetical protein